MIRTYFLNQQFLINLFETVCLVLAFHIHPWKVLLFDELLNDRIPIPDHMPWSL